MKEEIVKELEIWLRGREGFPREYSNSRKIVYTFDELLQYINENPYNVYVSVFSQRQIAKREFDTIFIDVDRHGGTGKNVYDKARKIVSVFDVLDIATRQYYSGRGFHIYIDFPQIHLEKYRDVVRYWLKNVLGKYYNWLDKIVIGDIRRLGRVPWTVNTRTGITMKRVDVMSWDWEKIKEYVLSDGYIEIDYELWHGNTELTGTLLEIEFEGRYSKGKKSFVDRDLAKYFEKKRNIYEMPPCIREGIERLLMYGELEHYWRMHVATFLLRAWGYEDTLALFRMASDFDKRKTEYQLKYFIRNNIHSFSCKTALEYGVCPYTSLEKQKECPFWPSVNHWVKTYQEVYGGEEDGKGEKYGD